MPVNIYCRTFENLVYPIAIKAFIQRTKETFKVVNDDCDSTKLLYKYLQSWWLLQFITQRIVPALLHDICYNEVIPFVTYIVLVYGLQLLDVGCNWYLISHYLISWVAILHVILVTFLVCKGESDFQQLLQSKCPNQYSILNISVCCFLW